MMFFLHILMLVLFASIVQAQPSSSVSMFSYQPDRIKPGTVYHYTKSNLDGSKPATVSIFIATPDTLEVFKAEEGVIDAAHIVARMDWSIFSATSLDSGHHLKDGTRRPVVKLFHSKESNEVSVQLNDQNDKVTIGHYPFHIYNFDFISLNYAFRHLKDPEKAFEIGIADPVFQGEGLIAYKGKAKIEFVEDSPCHKNNCRKYKVSGEPFGDKEGFIWVNKNQGHIENIEIQVPDNPDWNSFKFELKKMEQMTSSQWESYKKNNVGRKPFP